MDGWSLAMAALGLLLTGGTALTGTVIFILDRVRNCEEKMRLEESKGRHDLRNDFQVTFNKYEIRLDRLETKVANEVAKREDITELERRFGGALAEVKIAVERVTDKLSSLPVIERDIKALSEQMRAMSHPGGDD